METLDVVFSQKIPVYPYPYPYPPVDVVPLRKQMSLFDSAFDEMRRDDSV